MLIITGAIDLSIGSVVGFSAVAFGVMTTWGINIGGIRTGPIHPYAAVPIVLAMGVAIGLVNGLLVTRLKLQAFLVTLCGLFVYRGTRPLHGWRLACRAPRASRPPTRHSANRLNALRLIFIGKDENRVLLFPAEMVVLLRRWPLSSASSCTRA